MGKQVRALPSLRELSRRLVGRAYQLPAQSLKAYHLSDKLCASFFSERVQGFGFKVQGVVRRTNYKAPRVLKSRLPFPYFKTHAAFQFDAAYLPLPPAPFVRNQLSCQINGARPWGLSYEEAAITRPSGTLFSEEGFP